MRNKQIERNIAVILKHNQKKVEQLEKVQSISSYLTSDDGIHIEAEIYGGGIARYLITGTRCGMTVTANTITNEIVRKPRNAKPFYTAWTHANASDIFEILDEIK